MRKWTILFTKSIFMQRNKWTNVNYFFLRTCKGISLLDAFDFCKDFIYIRTSHGSKIKFSAILTLLLIITTHGWFQSFTTILSIPSNLSFYISKDCHLITLCDFFNAIVIFLKNFSRIFSFRIISSSYIFSTRTVLLPHLRNHFSRALFRWN